MKPLTKVAMIGINPKTITLTKNIDVEVSIPSCLAIQSVENTYS